MAADTDKQSFWEHLDVLRAAIVKSLLVAVVFGVAAFCFKEELFAVPFTRPAISTISTVVGTMRPG